MNIEWKEGAVCYVTSEQRYANDDAEYIVSNSDKTVSFNSSRAISSHDFQLNEIREGDCIKSSELDTEQKYNNAVEVFGLFGFGCNQTREYLILMGFDNVFVSSVDGKVHYCDNVLSSSAERKITYKQLMAIGKLKRDMIEREKPPIDVSGFNTIEQSMEKRIKRNKSKQAYKILNDLDYEYDLDKQKWYKKQYV